jgi:hypothetical protein
VEARTVCRLEVGDAPASAWDRRHCSRQSAHLYSLFDSNFRLEFGRKQGSSKEEQERKRLIHKHKREFKGAVREIRKDNQFLARMQLSEIMER